MSDWKPGDTARCIDVRDIRIPLRHVATGGRDLNLNMLYPVKAVLKDVFGLELLDVGRKSGAKLAMRFARVDEIDRDEIRQAEVPVDGVMAE